MLVFGLFSYQRLAIEDLPDVDMPVVAVVVSYPGASAEAVENDIVRPIEESLNTISGIDNIESTARPGQAMIMILFELEVDSATAAQDVRDRIAQVEAALPEDADDPRILRFDPGQLPVLSLAVSSPTLSASELTEMTEDVIAQQLSVISGVGQVTVVG